MPLSFVIRVRQTVGPTEDLRPVSETRLRARQARACVTFLR